VQGLPEGTVTLLFSDIEGSTGLVSSLGAHWGEALSGQRAVLRAVWAAHDGHEMGTEGDSFFVVFGSARAAVLATSVSMCTGVHASRAPPTAARSCSPSRPGRWWATW
jgi:class 3 adenylate cyclase